MLEMSLDSSLDRFDLERIMRAAYFTTSKAKNGLGKGYAQLTSNPSFPNSLIPEETERLELVDELVDDVPEPLVGQFPVDGPVVVENEVEQTAVVVVGLVTVLEGGSVGHAGVDVTEVQLLVQDQEEWIVLT